LIIEKKSKKWAVFTLVLFLLLTVTVGCSTGEVKDKLDSTTSIKNEYRRYVQGVLDCSYKGDIDNYIKICSADRKEAEECYDAATVYYAEGLMFELAVPASYLSENMLEKWYDFGKKGLMETDYTVEEAVKKDGRWLIEVKVRPMDMLTDEIVDKVIEFHASFVEKYKGQDFESMSDEEYMPYADEYAEGVLQILTDNFEKREYLEEQSKTLEIKIDGNSYSVEESEWTVIDDMVMAFK